ncbi:MAG: amidohydrolase family protein [Candidatus Fermentithermobacillus carboniphilus]|uniref:Amidohydrolase family protein n=1 Tax=Candidatus Fermentithermobacillus carboniphilus TaxID=3085328 RepID=A0AAT9LC40_9FIRM|nr:MAG: amidohydrolase family protein [Candidatus Fermentithermobacillus carboniphilus]
MSDTQTSGGHFEAFAALPLQTPERAAEELEYAVTGFPTDTTLCIARLIFAGIFDRFPGVKLIASHLGGALPYLSERLDRGFAAYPECHRIERARGEYLKEIFYDCVLFNPLTVEYAVKMFGASQFVVGSDYPHQIGDLGKAVSTIRALPISDHEKEMILGKNAEQLLKIGACASGRQCKVSVRKRDMKSE